MSTSKNNTDLASLKLLELLMHQQLTFAAQKNPYLPVMPQKLPGFAVDVTQIYSADKARRVQVSEVSDVCCIFRNLLSGGEVNMRSSSDCFKSWLTKSLSRVM